MSGDKFPEGDPVEVHPSDSRAESQAGSNGPSGSPTSPSGRASAGASMSGDPKATRVAFSVVDVKVGDMIAYPAFVTKGRGHSRHLSVPRSRNARDWLTVTRIEGDTLFGTRVHPEGWERGMEFGVFPLQLRENGVQVIEPGRA